MTEPTRAEGFPVSFTIGFFTWRRWGELRVAKRWSKTAKSIVKAVLAIIVLAAVGRQIVLAKDAMFARGDRPRFDPVWVSASIAAYLVGLCASGIFFGRVLKNTPAPVGYAPALRAT